MSCDWYYRPILRRRKFIEARGALDGVGVGAGLIDLVDGEDDGNARSHGVVDGFLGLGHHIVVGGNDDKAMSVTCAPRARMAVNAS